MKHADKLTILDLDNTLVYGSYIELKSIPLLFRFSEYLWVYARPYVREFVEQCKTNGDVIVYTTSRKEYAERICDELRIHPMDLISRENAEDFEFTICKAVKEEWLEKYDRIVLVEDTPQIWTKASHEKCTFIIPREFRGEPDDEELLKLMEQPSSLK